MADAVTFRAALGRIGLNHNTQLAINANGLNTIFDLIEAQKVDLVNLPKHLRDWRIPAAAEADQVRAPLMSLRRLKAMRYWALEQTYVGVLPSATSFTPAVLEIVDHKSDGTAVRLDDGFEVTKDGRRRHRRAEDARGCWPRMGFCEEV
jgi:hypothetical protein